MVTINELVEITSKVANKSVQIKHIPGPLGVRGRNSDNKLIREKLNWEYKMSLEEGIKLTFDWISSQVKNAEIVESAKVN
jgi:nucleoside-diphosphate-sugar epimerase